MPIRTDQACGAYGAAFVPLTMVCAGAADPPNSSDTCSGDSGGPLLVDDGSAFVLTGVVSFGNGCNEQGFPGVYTRVGAQPLNAWVRGQINDVDFTIPTAAPRAGEPVAFAATAPAGAAFSWDFDNDGAFDATGPSPTHVYAAAGEFEAVLRITDPEGQPAEQRHELVVAPGAPPSIADRRAADDHGARHAAGHDPRYGAATGAPRPLQPPHQLRRDRAVAAPRRSRSSAAGRRSAVPGRGCAAAAPSASA